MTADPDVRSDGLCVVCLKPRGAVSKNLVKKNRQELVAQLAADPFCSNVCCRSWYGATIRVDSIWSLTPLARAAA